MIFNFKKDEHLLIFLSSLSFIIGFSLLIYLYANIKTKFVEVSEINEELLFQSLIVKGNLTKIVEKEKVNYLEIKSLNPNCQFCLLTIIVFPNVYQYLRSKLEINQIYCIEGKLQIYKSTYQIILDNPSKIKKCD